MKKISISHKVLLTVVALSSFSAATFARADIIERPVPEGCSYDADTGLRTDLNNAALITILPYCDKNIANGDATAMAALSGGSSGSDLTDICGKLENMPQPIDPIVDPIKPTCPAVSCTVQLSQSVAEVAELESALSQANARISALSAKLANFERCGKAKCPSRSGSKTTKGKNSSSSASN